MRRCILIVVVNNRTGEKIEYAAPKGFRLIAGPSSGYLYIEIRSITDPERHMNLAWLYEHSIIKMEWNDQ